MSSQHQGRIKIAQLSDFHGFAQSSSIIDVRSPAEFADDHIPGALNCPVLDNAQRIEVGTLYQQHSPFAAKKIGAAYVAENIAKHLRASFQERPLEWQPLIVCWRGGQRSGAMTLILRRVGWDALQLEGGYKHYRKLVLEQLDKLPQQLRFKVVCGATGSAKSRLLQALAEHGEQVLDLEQLACHKGSILGVLPTSTQPSQKMFETQLVSKLLEFSPDRPVYVEAESRKIGSIALPNRLLETMRNGQCLELEANLNARIDFLLSDYAYFLSAPDWLNARLDVFERLHSHAHIQRWKNLAQRSEWRSLVGELLEQHYDPLYRHSQKKHFSGLNAPLKLQADQLSPEKLSTLARQIIESANSA